MPCLLAKFTTTAHALLATAEPLTLTQPKETLMITVPHHVLLRACALHAAADQEVGSAVLSGVCIHFRIDTAVITAGDGRIAIEETHRLPCAAAGGMVGIIAPESIKRLRLWLGLRQRVRSNMPFPDLTVTPVARPDAPPDARILRWMITDDQGENIAVRLVEGNYPDIGTALDAIEKSPKDVGRFGMNAHYFAVLSKLWSSKNVTRGGSTSSIEITSNARGFICKPLRPFGLRERAVVMPITLQEQEKKPEPAEPQPVAV